MRFWILACRFWIDRSAGLRGSLLDNGARIQNPKSKIQNAFTLIELMLALAIALLLIVGVSTVFQMAGQAVGTGQTVSTAVRNYRAAAAVMTEDFRNCATDSPVFIIDSGRVFKALNLTDLLRSSGYRHQFDYESAQVHRTDVVRFFARGMYRRQSANDGSFTSPTTSTEAYVSYGHAGHWWYSGQLLTQYVASGFPRQYYYNYLVPEAREDLGISNVASEWVLGRSAILLKDPASIPAGEHYLARETNPPAMPPMAMPTDVSVLAYFPRVYWPWWYRKYDDNGGTYVGGSYGPWEVTFNLSPLCYGTRSTDGGFMLHDSRYDLAGTTIDQFRQYVAQARTRQSLFPTNAPSPAAGVQEAVRIVRWWHPLVMMGDEWFGGDGWDWFLRHGGHPRHSMAGVSRTYVRPLDSYGGRPVVYDMEPKESRSAVLGQNRGLSWHTTRPIRFGCDAGATSPVTSLKAAQAAPYFLQYCSQFGVEYAGDYLMQTDDGTATAATPDGKVDFIVRTVNGRAIKEIRWYGMPRDVDGDGVIPGWIPGRTTNQLTDVVPLRDVVRTIPAHSTPPPDAENPTNYFYGLPHEKDVDGVFMPSRANYAVDSTDTRTRDREKWCRYICVWTNDVPAMVRVWMQVDDTTERMIQGQRTEMVFRLK